MGKTSTNINRRGTLTTHGRPCWNLADKDESEAKGDGKRSRVKRGNKGHYPKTPLP